MGDKVIEDRAVQAEGAGARKKPGRRRMTPEEKMAAAQVRAAEKEKASNLKPELFIQYQGEETDLDTLVELAKTHFRAEKKRTPVTGLRLYIKPKERTAYYVVNDKYKGQVSF